MPLLEVKPGISLAYLDSGAPDPSNEEYMTVFALHGYIFHTPFFKPATTVANKHNIRFVAITRRDYPGSSLLTDEDVKAALEGPAETILQTLKERGREILCFIDQFININKIPPIGSNGGGFSLLGWSLGNNHSISVLAFGSEFPDLVGRLTPYFRSHISHETVAFFPYPNFVYNPLLDESKPKEERESLLLDWISSHFIHPNEGLISGNIDLLSYTPDATRPSVFAQLTGEERATMLDGKPPTRADVAYNGIDQAVNEYLLKHAFVQQVSQQSIAWPNVPVRLLYGDQSCPVFLFGQWELEKWTKIHLPSAKENGRWARTFESTCTPGVSHFFHYEEPDSFVEAVKRLML